MKKILLFLFIIVASCKENPVSTTPNNGYVKRSEAYLKVNQEFQAKNSELGGINLELESSYLTPAQTTALENKKAILEQELLILKTQLDKL